jgi:hypothetical protein
MADTHSQLQPAKPVGPKTQGTTVYLAPDPLRSIYVYVDATQEEAKQASENAQSGTVTFVTQGGRKLGAQLIRTWFPAGTWHGTLDATGNLSDVRCKFPADIDSKVVETLRERGTRENLIAWAQTADVLAQIDKLQKGSRGQTIRIVVAYSKAQGGDVKSLPEKLDLTAGDNTVLKDPRLAEMYLQFVEHFGKVRVDHALAVDGLTEQEIAQVESDRPNIIAITNLFVQGVAEFNGAKGQASPSPDLDNLRAMLEVIFYQKQAKNDLARRNMLAIGIAELRVHEGNGQSSTKQDIGVHRRVFTGRPSVLLYDRFGSYVASAGRPLDTEYRSIDLEKINRDSAIPHFSIEVSDKGLYLFLRSLEQQLGEPLREVEALAASLYKHTIYISHEIDRRYNGQIGARIIEMAPVVIAFFVVHAIASRLLATGHPAAFAFMALVKGAGLVFGIDFALINMSRLAQAGAHFHRMEELHREVGEKAALTKLSEQHLYLGAMALIDAMADFIATGVLIAGSLGVTKGRALVEGLKKSREARVELTVENGRATKITSTRGETRIEAAVPKKPTQAKGLQTNERKPPDESSAEPHAVEEPGPSAAEGRHARQPEIVKHVVKRPRALDMSADQLRADTAAQRELFEAAQQAVERQNAFIRKLLADLGIKDAEATSILKRPTFEEFIEGVLAKVGGRKGYKTVGEMSDMIRGRVNLEKPEQVAKAARALRAQKEMSAIDFEKPQARMGIEGAYPRYHVDVVDPVTGLKHEWQIGTKQTTRLYEQAGIEVGKLDIKPENRNVHDVEYDIFKSINDPAKSVPAAERAALQRLAEEVGIPAYRRKVARLSARLGKENISGSELESMIKALHTEASAILARLVELKGGDPDGLRFVESFLH